VLLGDGVAAKSINEVGLAVDQRNGEGVLDSLFQEQALQFGEGSRVPFWKVGLKLWVDDEI
jgi:hypothetical protein